MLVAIAVVLRSVAALAVSGPWLLPDEGAYALIGRSFWHHAKLAPLGGPAQFESALYPVLAWLPGYDALRVLQVLILCAAAVVVFAWSRSLVAGVLALALPGLVYAGTITAEALFVPLASLAGWAAVRALERPTLRRQAVLVGTLLACILTRGEANMLALAAFAAAVAVRRVRALWPTWSACAAICVAWLALGGGSPLRSLGGYGPTTGYTAGGVTGLVLEHAALLLLISGVVPVCAALMLLPDRAARATVVYALALGVIASIEVGLFAAGHAGRLLERELLFALPPLLVCFGIWLGRGAPRPRLRALGVAAAAAAALVAVPFGRLATSDAAPDNPSLVPLTHLDSPKVYAVVALVATVAAVLFVILRGRSIWLLPALLLGVFAAASVAASEDLVDRSQAAHAAYVARPDAHWVEHAASGPVTFLFDGVSDWRLVWTQLYSNGRVRHVLDLPATHVPGPLPQTQLQIIQDDGRLRSVGGAVPDAPYLVAPQGFHFRGDELGRARRLGLALWRIAPPLRLRSWAQGVQPNGDVLQGGVATLDVFDCGRGSFHVVAVGRDNETLQLSQGGTVVTQTRLWPHGVWEYSVDTPARAAGARCTFSLSTTSLVHLTTFAWTAR
jgi:hypothetical protein